MGRPGFGAVPRPTARPLGKRPRPATHWLWVRGVWAWEPVTIPTACALASRLRALSGGMRASRGGGGRLLSACGSSGVGGSLVPDRPSLGRAAGAHYPLAVAAGGDGVGTRHQPDSARSCEPVCALWGGHEGTRRGRLLPGCGASGLGRCPTPDRPSLGRAAGGPLPTGCGSGGSGRGDPSPSPQGAVLRADFACCGGSARAPGGRASCLRVGRPGLGALLCPTARPWGVRLRPATHCMWVRGVWVWGPVTYPTARAPATWLCALWGRHKGARGGAPLACLTGVCGWALANSRPPVLGACGRGPLPTGCGCGGCGRGDPSPFPQRALLRADFGRCGGGHVGVRGGRLLPACGASRVGPCPTPDRPSLGRAAVARYRLAVGAGAVGVGTRHQCDSAPSCELALRVVGRHEGAWGVRLLPACGASGIGRSPTPDRPSLGRAAGARYPLAEGAVCGLGAWLSLAPAPVPRFVLCCACFPGSWHPVAVVAWHLCLCRGCGRRCSALACLVDRRWCAAPRPVRSLSVLGSAFPSRWCIPPARGLSPPALLGGCEGHAEASRESGSLCLPLAPADAGALGSLRIVPIGGPTMGLSLAGPSDFGLRLRALRWFGVCGPGH